MLSYTDDTLLYLNHADVVRACQDVDSVSVMQEVFRLHGSGQTILPDEAYLGWTNDEGESVRSLNMPGFLGGALHIAGTKIINGNISNPRRGLPRASGLMLLYDTTTARVRCIMEGAYLSSLRTASVSALAVDLLQGRQSECMAVIGAGELARAHIQLLAAWLPHLRSIRIYDLDKERITALQREFAPMLHAHNIVLQPVASAEEAIGSAQLVIPATTTTTGYIQYAWLQPGSLLINISLDDPLPEVALKADRIIVDDWNLVKNDSRRLLGRMYREGTIVGPQDTADTGKQASRKIDAQLGDLVTGAKEGRHNAREIILVNPFGLAIEDVALAAHVYQKARAKGIGLLLDR